MSMISMQVTTVKVHGPHMLTAYGEIDQVLSNVRFAISGGADFNLQSVMGTLNVAMMFTGITELVRARSGWFLLRSI